MTSDRCPICHGIHAPFPCPLEASMMELERITDEQHRASERFLERCAREGQRDPRSHWRQK